MTERVSKEQAVNVLRVLTAQHKDEDYFQKADVVGHDIGFGVDLWVDREKWYAAKAANDGKDLVPPRIDRVPICVLLVG